MHEKVQNKNKTSIINFEWERKLLIALSVSAAIFFSSGGGNNSQNSLELILYFQLGRLQKPIRNKIMN